MQGGDFKDGFLGASFSSLVSANLPVGIRGDAVLHGVAVTVSGGTASVIGGGKFKNGAYSAAFTYAFNQVAGEQVRRNRDNHERAVAEQMAIYEAAGFIVTPRVRFLDPETGLGVEVDFMVSTAGFPMGNPLFGVDVKTGSGNLTNNQKLLYPKLEAGGFFTPRGMAAFRAGFIPGVPVYIKMKVEIPRIDPQWGGPR